MLVGAYGGIFIFLSLAGQESDSSGGNQKWIPPLMPTSLTTSARYVPGYQRFHCLPKTPAPTSGDQGFNQMREPVRDISHSNHPHKMHTSEEDRDIRIRQGKSSLHYNAANPWWKARSSKVMATCLLHFGRHSWTWGIKTCPHVVHPVVYIEHLGMEGEQRYVGQSLECWFRVNIGEDWLQGS